MLISCQLENGVRIFYDSKSKEFNINRVHAQQWFSRPTYGWCECDAKFKFNLNSIQI